MADSKWWSAVHSSPQSSASSTPSVPSDFQPRDPPNWPLPLPPVGFAHALRRPDAAKAGALHQWPAELLTGFDIKRNQGWDTWVAETFQIIDVNPGKKRSAPCDAGWEEESTSKAPRTSNETDSSDNSHSVEEEGCVVYGELHVNIGQDGQYWCSCGRGYSCEFTRTSDAETKVVATNLVYSRGEDESDENLMHLEVGRDINGKHWCSCRRGYTTAYRLRQHLEPDIRKRKFHCSVCSKAFTRNDACRRHENVVCKKQKLPCPGCRRPFRKDYLHVHLASKAAHSCRLFVDMLKSQAAGELVAGFEASDAAPGQNLQISEERHPPQTLVIIQAETHMHSKFLASMVTRLTTSGAKSSAQPYEICGKAFGDTEDALIDHIKRHAREISERPARCHACEMTFAFQKDLDRHLQAAAKGTCGLNFDRHDCVSCGLYPNYPGHHPPPVQNTPTASMHHAMQAHLWSWEIWQIKAHRHSILRLWETRLSSPQVPRLSLNDYLLVRASSSRFSYATLDSIESWQSTPTSVGYGHLADLDALAIDLGQSLAVEDLTTSGAAPHGQDTSNVRPESPVLGNAQDDLSAAIEPARPVQQRSMSLRPSYVDHLDRLRKPVKLSASNFSGRRAAQAAVRYLGRTPKVQQIMSAT
ncbi:hypothetical protein LTR15_010661 [Elasticomyces elasticus]|nr:hypothetical protein LTR15_010661 [Elasticomyces elasticus]